MKRLLLLSLALMAVLRVGAIQVAPDGGDDRWPDGTPIDAWFGQEREVALSELGTPLRLDRWGVEADSTQVQTAAIQRVIDTAAQRVRATGERQVVVVPRGTYLTGALFLRQGVNLWLEEGARLKGSDDISDFPVVETRIEGQTCRYFAALVNADSIAGLTIAGRGTIDGNGLRYWRAFWLRRAWNPQCTNKDEQRPRLLYLSRCSDVTLQGLTLQNSPFWTTHLYKCTRARLSRLRILAPVKPVKAPSSDAIDVDACQDIHVSHCYMAVNDDAIALKGGKGPWADRAEENGANERVLVEDCEYGFCHSCLTCGSEAIHNRNIVLRRIKVGQAVRLLWLKMRPDTPQHYEYISVSDIEGQVGHFLYVHPWKQFFDLQGRTDMPRGLAEHVRMSRCRVTCDTFLNVGSSQQYELRDFLFSDLQLTVGGKALHVKQQTLQQ